MLLSDMRSSLARFSSGRIWLALRRAREHGLDMDRAVVVTAERTIERAFEVGLVQSFSI
jgi:hypothetical protein